MKRLKWFILIGLLLTVNSSCEKLFIEPDPENTAVNNFDSMWKRLDEKYSFFTLKHINWDSVYAVYRPKVYNGMSQDSLFRVLSAVLYTLRDGHVNLVSEFDVSRNWEWYLDYPQNFNFSVLERNYLGNDYLITGPFINQIFAVNGKTIGYMRYSSFQSNISDYDLDFVLDRMSTTNGLIIDLRDNGGGLTTEVYQFINRFVDSKILIGRSYEKSGAGHDDFNLALEMYAEPEFYKKNKPKIQYLNKKVVLLTNRSCYSSCNMFAGFMSILPNVVLVGDNTGGGGGLPVSYQLPNGWTYRFSASKTLLPNEFDIELGVPVDVKVDMNPVNESNGIDDILETAFLQF